MARPDPKLIARRPMASADLRYTVSGPEPSSPSVQPIFGHGRLNVNTLCELIEGAQTLCEGRVEHESGGDRFYGSCVFGFDVSLAVEEGSTGKESAEALVISVQTDPRAIRVVEARAYRETVRLLGGDASAQFDSQVSAHVDGSSVRIVVDFECPLGYEAKIAR